MDMDKPIPAMYADFAFQDNTGSTIYDYGYTVLCTVLVGSGAIFVDIIVYFVLTLVKRLIQKYLITEDMQFVIDLLFGVINLSVTAWLAYFVDRRLRMFWAKRKYGLNNSFSLSD
ncbi:hypothetical protein ACROYT_G037515 [Oculina patagonica]